MAAKAAQRRTVRVVRLPLPRGEEPTRPGKTWQRKVGPSQRAECNSSARAVTSGSCWRVGRAWGRSWHTATAGASTNDSSLASSSFCGTTRMRQCRCCARWKLERLRSRTRSAGCPRRSAAIAVAWRSSSRPRFRTSTALLPGVSSSAPTRLQMCVGCGLEKGRPAWEGRGRGGAASGTAVAICLLGSPGGQPAALAWVARGIGCFAACSIRVQGS